MRNLIIADKVSKAYGDKQVLQNITFNLTSGKIVGLLGCNGAGKTTLLRSMMGLTTHTGNLSVLDLVPMRQRYEMMQRIAFIADTAILPKWITINQAIKFMQKTHAKFDVSKALVFLNQTNLPLNKKVKTFSKGMTVQAHLALLMAVDSEVMILDEPTLGLDPLYRKKFYSHLINNYYNENRSIIISSHQIEEIEHLLTDIMIIDKGEIILNSSMDAVYQRYCSITVNNDKSSIFMHKKPLGIKKSLVKSTYIFDRKFNTRIDKLGTMQPVSLYNLFIALLENKA